MEFTLFIAVVKICVCSYFIFQQNTLQQNAKTRVGLEILHNYSNKYIELNRIMEGFPGEKGKGIKKR